MSRAYKVTWVTVQTTVTASDTLSMGLSLLTILPPAEMAALTRDELLREGWSRRPNGTTVKHVDGAVLTLDADATTVTVTAEITSEVRARGPSVDAAEDAVKQGATRAQRRVEQTVRATLDALEPEIRGHLGEAVQRVYVKALRRKAASMGTVESVLESRGKDGAYELTIKVKT